MSKLLSYPFVPLGGPKYGCFAKIPRPNPDEDKRYLETTYYASYNKQFDNMRFKPQTTKMFDTQKIYCGLNSNYEPIDQIKISTKLISEKYNKLPELKFNTECQRTWYPYRDPGIRAVEDLKIDNRFKKPYPFISTPLSLFTNSEVNYEKMRSKTFYGCGRKMCDVVKRKLEKDKVK